MIVTGEPPAASNALASGFLQGCAVMKLVDWRPATPWRAGALVLGCSGDGFSLDAGKNPRMLSDLPGLAGGFLRKTCTVRKPAELLTNQGAGARGRCKGPVQGAGARGRCKGPVVLSNTGTSLSRGYVTSSGWKVAAGIYKRHAGPGPEPGPYFFWLTGTPEIGRIVLKVKPFRQGPLICRRQGP